MKRAVFFTGIILLLFFSWEGFEALAATPAPATEPKPGGRLIIGLVAEPTSMDPAQVTDINSIRVHRSIYDSLVHFAEEKFVLVPGLATSWEISTDGLLYTFHLRTGVQFHDGQPFNAEAVQFTFERMLNKDHPYHDTGPFPFAGFFYGAIKETKVVDDHTVQMILTKPFSPLLNNLTEPLAGIISPAAVQRWRKDFAQHPVGTGPFRFAEWQRNVRVVLEKNPHYWGEGPYLDTVIFRPIVEEQVRLTELLSGRVDFIVDVPPDNIAQIQADPNLRFIDQPGPHTWWVALNLAEPPFNDIRVRHAVNYAVNKEGITRDILKNTGMPAFGPIPPAVDWAYTENVPRYPYHPKKARALLKEAGWEDTNNDGILDKNGQPFEIIFWVTESGSGMQSPKTMAQAIQADLASIGIQARIQTFEWGAYLTKYNAGLKGEAHMAEMSWMIGSGDPDLLLSPTLSSEAWAPAGFNTGYFKNDRVDEILAQAKRIIEQKERGKLYRELQQIVAQEAPWIFVDHQIQNAAMHNKVQGFTLHPSFIFSLHTTWIKE